MTRYTKTQITQLSANEQAALNAINKNFEDLEAAIQDTVSRSGNTPTHMTNDLDMNGKRLINVPAPRTGTDVVRQQDVVGDIETVQQLVNATTNAAAQTLKAAQDVQEIIEDRHIGIVADDLALGDNSKIKKDADNIEDITTVADHISDINTANSNITNIDKVADDISNVNTVAGDISNVNTCASNMSAIQDAPTHASNAANSATAAAGSASAAATAASTMRLSLFDFKWTDYEQADQSWLRADTFSWQDGTVYTNAYNHLVADYQGGTSQTETVGSYTITYYLADDGHKIVMADQETTVQNIYADYGISWYYILDTTNQRFKLPRSSDKVHGEVIESGKNGTQWYKIYEDGWCRQGGYWSGNNGTTITLTKSFKDNNWTLTYANWEGTCYARRSGTNQIVMHDVSNANSKGYSWIAEGELSSYSNPYVSQRQAKNRYLYFYVGQFSQSATEQTAGLNSELFNGKVDLNLNNMDPSQTSKETIVGWSMPSELYENIALGPNGVLQIQHYTAPADGYAFVNSPYYGQSNAFVRMTVRPSGNQSDSNYYASEHFFYNSSGNASLFLPVKKGADVELYYTMTWGTVSFFKFIYAQGEV